MPSFEMVPPRNEVTRTWFALGTLFPKTPPQDPDNFSQAELRKLCCDIALLVVTTMKMLLLPVLVLLLACCCTPTNAANSAIKFDGCYKGLDERLGISHDLPKTNLNADCAHFCGFAGYILAATQDTVCHCTNQVVKDPVQTPYDVLTAGNVECDTVCPGAAHTTDEGEGCEGDTCCGNPTKNTYAVYAVGGIDLLQLIQKRIRKAVNSRMMPWINSPVTSTCSREYVEYKMPHGLNALLNVSDDQQDTIWAASVHRCQDACLRKGTSCLSIAYIKKAKTCYLYKTSIDGADMKPVPSHTVMYERDCNDSVRLKRTIFQVHMIKQDLFTKKVGSTNAKMLNDTNFQLDLTHSNSFDQMERTFDTTVSDTTMISTDSGFDLDSSRSNTESTETSTEKTDGSTRSSEKSKSNTFNSEVSVTASVSVGFGWFEASASATAGASANLGFSSSSASSSSSSNTASKSTSNSVSQETSNSRTFNSGYSSVGTSSKLSALAFSMTVPAFHKGTMVFSKHNYETLVKIRSTFQLNGYLKFLIAGKEKEVHVSRVLTSKDRVFATFTTLAMNRPTISAKTVISRNGVELSVDDVAQQRQK